MAGLRSRGDKYTKLVDDDPSTHHYAKDAEREEQERRRALSHYKRKVVLLSIGLSVASVVFTVLAYLHCAGHHRHHEGAGWGFMLLAALTGIPGWYSAVVVFGAWRKWPGYSYTDLPLY